MTWFRKWLPVLAAGLAGAVAASAQEASAPELVRALVSARAQGCAGQPGSATALRERSALSEAAARIARGEAAREALQAEGYRAQRFYHLRMSGYRSSAAAARTLTERYCTPLTDPQLSEVGIHQQGGIYVVLLASPMVPPPAGQQPALAARILTLVNEARSEPRRCGSQSLAPAPPLRPNPVLDAAAEGHARDMAEHSYFAHEGRDGSTFADRISRAGYRWRSAGENLASGQTTPEDVVRAWLASPSHCANLMNPAYTEMGLAYAVNPASTALVYWAQTFGRPR